MNHKHPATSKQLADPTRAAAFRERGAQAGAAGTISAAIGGSPKVAAQRAARERIQISPRMAVQRAQLAGAFGAVAQCEAATAEDELQMKAATLQAQGLEEEPLQGRFATVQKAGSEEEHPLQGKFAQAQRVEKEEPSQAKRDALQRMEEEPLQGRFGSGSPVQAESQAAAGRNDTGLPDKLKSGVEALSGVSLDDVRVHYNSSRPAQLNALAYAQGADIHVAPGQEQHLPHEAWHVVQQSQGRVRPTMEMAGAQINDDVRLETEADAMGGKAMTVGQRMVETTAKGGGDNSGSAESVKCEDTATTAVQPMADRSADRGPMPIQMEREFGYYSRDGKRKSPRVIIMEEFGDRNRIHGVEPNLYRERVEGEEDLPEEQINKKTGIYRPSGEGARPEDPPIYQPFRTAFHALHNTLLSISDVERMPADQRTDFKNRFLAIGSEVKQLSLVYKGNVRNVDEGRMTMDAATQAYIQGLDDLINRDVNGITALHTEMLNAFTGLQDAPEGIDAEDLQEHIFAEKQKRGEDIWRAQWWAAVQKVNLILKRTWEKGKKAIQKWVGDKRKERTWYRRRDALPYMEESMVGDVDYIGSLAKGYKSPPKQYVRFMSEKFDVDGNLSAPPLAVYAISQGGEVDRGSVRAGQYVPPLRDFEQATWAELRNVPGIDEGDPFEVFVKAEGVNELVTGGDDDVARAQRVVSTSNRIQAIKDRLWAVRVADNDAFNDLKEALGGYLNEQGELQGRDPEDEEEFIPLDDTDLTFMEATIRSFEPQPQEEEEEED